MDVIREDIVAAVNKELHEAEKNFGLHNSQHEKYAVMLEEFEEAKEDLTRLDAMLNAAWEMVRHDELISDMADAIYHTAINAAVECCQLAAMARKGYKND